MRKIKDKHTLGVISGVIGGLSMLVADQISNKYLKLSKRTYTYASAGVWVGKKRQVKSTSGTALGISMSLITSIFGSIIITEMIAKRGKDNINTKGLFYGAAYGGIVTAIQSALPKNKLKPRDASSNLSYLFCNALFGLVTANSIAKLGDDSIFPDSKLNTETINTKILTNQNNDDYRKPVIRPETQESFFQTRKH